MAKRIGRYTLQTENNPSILASAAICGKKEAQGPLGQFFDQTFEDSTLGEPSFEKAESKLQCEAVNRALNKAGVTPADIEYIFAGDLLNQCTSSTFGLRSLGIPFLGQYGACSTMAQTLAMSAIMVDTGVARTCLAVTSSHFCAAERQYRFPLEYGGQRFQTAQWTVTGAGAAVIGEKREQTPYISAITIGKIADLGVKDSTNMGAAMAPAAVETLSTFLKDSKTNADDYDLILTGDLGEVGSELFKQLLTKNGINIGQKHNDCGLMIYDKEKQDVHAGGSGCGCSASVLCSFIMQKMLSGKLSNILFMATGALMSPTSQQQGETIPSIAHLVNIKI